MIIVLAGAMGSGKDTIGDILVKNHGFRKIAFADPLKKMAKLAFPAFTDEDLYGPSSKRATQYPQYPFSGICLHCGCVCDDAKDDPTEAYWPEGFRYHCEPCDANYTEFVSPRMALQSLGTEWGRRLYSNTWVDSAFEFIKMNPKTIFLPKGYDAGDWVITDCRFKNEVEGSKKNGGLVVRLTRNMGEATTSHASEAELKTIPVMEFDYVFDNGPMKLEDLPAEVVHMLECFKNGTRYK